MFDIDKLYLASLAYDVEDGKASREFTQDKKQYYQNKLLENYMTLLKDNDNSIQIAMRSIDNDTELVDVSLINLRVLDLQRRYHTTFIRFTNKQIDVEIISLVSLVLRHSLLM